jgi:ubiquinone biosynthesis protein UbiJ
LSLPTAITAAVEAAVNRYLDLDPLSRGRLQDLEGRVIAVELADTALELYFLPGAGGMQILEHYEGQADTRLRSNVFGLAELTLGRDRERALFSGDVMIEGDMELGQRFQELLAGVRIDWEEHLSHLVGDVAAHQMGNLARGARDYAHHATETLASDLSEYLQEEARLLPARIEIENFMNDVDGLRLDTDRLEARIRRLQARVGAESK